MISKEDEFLCEQQRDYFAYIYKKLVNMETYINNFMYSDFCNRNLDPEYSVYQCMDIYNWEEFLEQEFFLRPEPFKKQYISDEIAGWLGYMYRYIQRVTKLSSRSIVDAVPVNRLAVAYPALHTIDEDLAVDIIKKDFGI